VNVVAFSTPSRPDWRWRIVNYNSEMIEESSASYSTIAEAVAAGTERLHQQDDRERRRPVWPSNR